LYKASKQLDFVAWDSYPIGMLEYFATWESEEVKTRFARTGHPDLVSLNHDIYRGLKNGTDFWVMEQQCGHANWAQYNPLPAKGAVQLWTAQAWAHGASAVIYFRWRASHMAQEIMHSGLLQQDGRPDRGYPEVQNIDPSEFELGAIPAQVALLHDYNSMWIYNQQAHNQDLNYWHQFVQYYSALRSLGVDVDVIHPQQLDPKKYKMVVAPALTLMTQDIADKLSETAQHCPVILGPRSGFRTDSGRVPTGGQFALIEQLVGIKLANFDSLRPTLEQNIKAVDGDDYHIAKLWCESYEVVTANIVYKYSDGPLAGLPAVTEHQQVTVIGALSATLSRQILKQILLKQNIEVNELPDGVRISRRANCKLVMNFNQQEVNWAGITLPAVSAVKFEI
jgi:beta-galactosidase